MSDYKDVVENDIRLGDYITYGVKVGSSALLALGKVVAFGERKDSWTKEVEPFIKVKGIFRGGSGEFYPNKRVSQIGCFNRVLVIPAESVPQKYRFMMENMK